MPRPNSVLIYPLTDGDIAANNLESAQQQAWTRFWRRLLTSDRDRQAPERSGANGIELRLAGFGKIDNARKRYVGSRRWELRGLEIVRFGTDAANKLGSTRFNAAKHALEHMSAAIHTHLRPQWMRATHWRAHKHRFQHAPPVAITSSIRSASYQPRRVRN